MQQKEPSKAYMKKKVEAYKTMYQVMVSTNAEFINALKRILIEKETQHKQLEEKLKTNEATEQENAEYIFLGGYIKCLEDILNGKKNN